jgi:hypothetical protein
MYFRSLASVAALLFAASYAGAQTESQIMGGLPQKPGEATNPAHGSTDGVSSAAQGALEDVKEARSNIASKNYSAAKTNVANAQEDLKDVQSNPAVQQLEGALSKGKGSPFAKAQAQLEKAHGALAKGDPKAADSALGSVEGLLTEMI